MTKLSNIPEVDECLIEIFMAKSGNNSQAIADVEHFQEKLYNLARTYWEELLRVLKEGDFSTPDISSNIITALEDIPEEDLIILFKDKLLSNNEWEIRYAAIGALSRIKDLDLTDTFIDALNDRDSSIKSRAVRYLEKFGDRRALSGLKEVIQDKNLIATKPGIIDSAKRAVQRIENK